MLEPRKSEQKVASEIGPDNVLTDWVTSVVNFHHRYHQVRHCLNASVPARSSLHQTQWIGQCSLTQLIQLLDSMQNELENLLLEMGPLNQQPITNRYETVANHTRRLEHFNQHADVLLQLACLPAS